VDTRQFVADQSALSPFLGGFERLYLVLGLRKIMPWVNSYPAAPMNHVKYWRAGPAEMPLRNWYTANTNHFKLTDSVTWKWKTQPDWVIKPVRNILCGGSDSWEQKSPENDFKNLYWTVSKILSGNLFTCKGTYTTDWVRRPLPQPWSFSVQRFLDFCAICFPERPLNFVASWFTM